MIFDTHLHLIDRRLLSYPWLESVPALNHDASYDQYARTACRLGITDALHMEVDVAPADQDGETEMVRQLMGLPDTLIRGAIAACRPEDASFASRLDALLADPAVRGLRRVLHVVDDKTSTAPLFRENLRRLAGTRLTFDLCMDARQLPLAVDLVDACSGIAFVLDHCGVPDIKAGDFERWAFSIRELAKRDNVTAKISGIVAYAEPDAWTADHLRPYFETVVAAFGWTRVVWGSDSPVCTLTSSLEEWVATTHHLLDGTSADERRALLHDNAVRVYGP